MAEKADQRGRHGDVRHSYTPGWKVGVKHANGSVMLVLQQKTFLNWPGLGFLEPEWYLHGSFQELSWTFYD